jgi:hypothetical protein
MAVSNHPAEPLWARLDGVDEGRVGTQYCQVAGPVGSEESRMYG